MTSSMTDLGKLILLDRYAQKDPQSTNLRADDMVIVLLEGKREIGQILSINRDNNTAAVVLYPSEDVLEHHPLHLMDRLLETTPEQIWRRVARGIASVELSSLRKEAEEKFYDLLEDWKFVPGGRILTSAGTDQLLTAYNCYVIPNIPDSRGGIFESLATMAEIMSRGGGVGMNISSLRPKNAYVKGVNGRSSGAVSWASLFSMTTGLIEQAGSRRGAAMIMMNDWHPELYDFINAKRTAGQITNANISVAISDAFMEAVKNDGDWSLRFPDTTHPQYDELWDGVLSKWEAAGLPVNIYKTVKARHIWDTIIESAWASAEPGVFFIDRYNQMSNSNYYPEGHVICTNPCITADTRVYTNQGLIRAGDLYASQKTFQVATDSRFGAAAMNDATPVFATGTKQVYRLQTKEGYHVRATANHQIMTPRGWVELQDLQPGDQIHILNQKGGFGSEGSLALGRIMGMYVGDGHSHNDVSVLEFWGQDRELAYTFSGYVQDVVDGMQQPSRKYSTNVQQIESRDISRIESVRLRRLLDGYGLVEEKYRIPEIVWQGTEEMQRGYLQGLFSADGHFAGTLDRGGAVRLTSISKELLEDVQQLLLNFGISSVIYKNRRGGNLKHEINGAEYDVQEVHDLHLGGESIAIFAHEIGFLNDYKQQRVQSYLLSKTRQPNRSKFTATVESIAAEGIEPVYDLTVEATHAFIANGIVVHNCAEQGLPAYGVCNLGALNLPKFFDPSHGDVDWDLLRDSVRMAVRFLDNVVDWTPYFLEENEKQQKAERRVGLGIMGLAELLIKMELRYGSDEAVKFTEMLMAYIRDHAYETSTTIAEEKGEFPYFDSAGFLNSGFAKTLPEDIRYEIRCHGMRNVTLLTVAPTGSTGTMVNTSTGIEPFFSWEWYRKGRLGTSVENAKIAQDWFDANPGETQLPSYFVTAMELTPLEHVRMQAAVQKYVDTSISKTVNAPNNYTIEQTSDLYMAMYDLGCKGGTIYRDGSRSEQVLYLKEEEKAKEAQPELVAALQNVFADISPDMMTVSISVGVPETCPECGETVNDSTCDIPCKYCGFMGCAV